MVDISMYSYLLQLPLWRYDRIPVVDGGQRLRSLVCDKRFPCDTDCPSTLLCDHIAHVNSFQYRVRKSVVQVREIMYCSVPSKRPWVLIRDKNSIHLYRSCYSVVTWALIQEWMLSRDTTVISIHL